MENKILKKLEELNVEYKKVEHKAVYTIEDMMALGDIFENAKICKNLFLRDQKGKKHYLIVLPEDKKTPLAELQTKIGSTKLSFASEERLMKYLKLTPGAVTPLAVVNDEGNVVEIIMDKTLQKEKLLGVHPCVNTSTILITPENLEKYVVSTNKKIKYI